ncbi:MAG: putative quinol monooxygenase [Pseudonocardia sp.]
MVIVVARYRARVGNAEAVAAALRDYVPLVRTEPGCLVFTVHRERENPREFLLHEQYRDDDALEAHRASTHFRAVARVRIWPLLERREVVLYDEL